MGGGFMKRHGRLKRPLMVRVPARGIITVLTVGQAGTGNTLQDQKIRQGQELMRSYFRTYSSYDQKIPVAVGNKAPAKTTNSGRTPL